MDEKGSGRLSSGHKGKIELRNAKGTSERWSLEQSIVVGIASGFILPYGALAIATLLGGVFRGPIIGRGDWGRPIHANDRLIDNTIAVTMLLVALATIFCATRSIVKKSPYRRFWIGFIAPALFTCITAAILVSKG